MGTRGRKKSYPRPIQSLVDCDYLDELPPEVRREHERFLQEYYNASFDSDPIHDDDGRRELYRAKNSRNRDLYAILGCTNRLYMRPHPSDEEGEEGQDLADTPDYLSSVEYRDALEAYREFLPIPRRKNGKPSRAEKAFKYQAAKARLDATKK